jgi:hypothetical protein
MTRSQIMNGPILLIACAIIFFIARHYSINQNKAQNKYLDNNGVYTIGEVIENPPKLN